jgi:hypothetical protein
MCGFHFSPQLLLFLLDGQISKEMQRDKECTTAPNGILLQVTTPGLEQLFNAYIQAHLMKIRLLTQKKLKNVLRAHQDILDLSRITRIHPAVLKQKFLFKTQSDLRYPSPALRELGWEDHTA